MHKKIIWPSTNLQISIVKCFHSQHFRKHFSLNPKLETLRKCWLVEVTYLQCSDHILPVSMLCLPCTELSSFKHCGSSQKKSYQNCISSWEQRGQESDNWSNPTDKSICFRRGQVQSLSSHVSVNFQTAIEVFVKIYLKLFAEYRKSGSLESLKKKEEYSHRILWKFILTAYPRIPSSLVFLPFMVLWTSKYSLKPKHYHHFH